MSSDYERRQFRGHLLVGAAVIVGILAMFVMITIIAVNAKRQDGQVQQQCIAAGKIWINGSCIGSHS